MSALMRRVLLVLALVVVGCGGSDTKKPTAATPTATEATTTPEPVSTPVPKLTDSTACTAFRDATCSVLRVPLDRSHPGAGSVELRVAVAGRRTDPVFLVLSGGPGEAGLFLLKSARRWLGPAANQVRLVALDQRGTGRDALNCPALQQAMGASDLTPPPAAAVTSCATKIGDQRRFFTTRDTVEDIEALRVALKTDKLALDGTSYGTFVAQRYALAHPKRVSGLVLDSVVPSEGASLLSEVSMKATRRVLGDETTKQLAKVVEQHHNGPAILDMLTGLSVGAPRGDGAASAIAAAANGNTGPLDGLIKGVRDVMRSWGAERLSQGLHASTLCADTPAPWGSAAAPLNGRRQALEQAAEKLDPYPYDRATFTGNGFAQQCLNWPPVDVPDPPPAGELPDVPTLLLAGEKDLSTPLEWTRSAARHAPQGKLIVAPGAGHGVQSQDVPEAIAAVRSVVASLK
jgi:pimeloyl-ACP methyl ester carboxylesterase